MRRKPYIGYDNMSERYVAHWLDVFGGRFSEPLGYGKRDGNSIRFVFEYPDGHFVNTFVWKPEHGKWQFVMESALVRAVFALLRTQAFRKYPRRSTTVNAPRTSACATSRSEDFQVAGYCFDATEEIRQ